MRSVWVASQMHNETQTMTNTSWEKTSSSMKGLIIGMYCCQSKASILSFHFPPKSCSFRCGFRYVAFPVTTDTHCLWATHMSSWRIFWLSHSDVVVIFNSKSDALQREKRLTPDYEVMMWIFSWWLFNQTGELRVSNKHQQFIKSQL